MGVKDSLGPFFVRDNTAPWQPWCQGYELVNSGVMDDLPGAEQLSRYFSHIGKKGGHSRAKKLTAEQRKEIATKASKAAAKARSKKAKKRKED